MSTLRNKWLRCVTARPEMLIEICSELLLLFEKDVLTMINVECATKHWEERTYDYRIRKIQYTALLKSEKRHNKIGKMGN